MSKTTSKTKNLVFAKTKTARMPIPKKPKRIFADSSFNGTVKGKIGTIGNVLSFSQSARLMLIPTSNAIEITRCAQNNLRYVSIFQK